MAARMQHAYGFWKGNPSKAKQSDVLEMGSDFSLAHLWGEWGKTSMKS